MNLLVILFHPERKILFQNVINIWSTRKLNKLQIVTRYKSIRKTTFFTQGMVENDTNDNLKTRIIQ